jgi:endonuclease/exonuclease/phosphatase family metal-dependent hydrolase
MRFLLYNIAYGAGAGARLHFPFPFAGHLKSTGKNLGNILDFIQSVAPDIVGLVEVDSGSFRSGRDNQAEIIADQLDYHHVFESKYFESSVVQRLPVLNKQGNAMLLNENVRYTRFHYLSVGVKRLVIEVGLSDVVVFLVHLSLKYRHRQYQLAELYALIRAADRPVIVAGDFNTFWGSKELQLFLAAANLKTANGQGEPSYPSRSPKKQLDFIFHSPEIQTTGFEIPPVRLSDHAPLIWDFEVAAAEEDWVPRLWAAGGSR